MGKKNRNKATFFKSTNPTQKQISRYTPEQQALVSKIQKLIPGGLQSLRSPGQNPYAGFEPIEQQYRNSFYKNTIPSLSERFASLGSGGSLSSSAFGQALGGAGADLESNLAALKSQYGQNQMAAQEGNYFNLLSAGLNPQQDTVTVPGQDSTVRKIWNNIGAPALQNYATGGLSTALGALGNRNQNQTQSPTYDMRPTQPGFQYQPNQLSVQNLASSGYNSLPQIGNLLQGLQPQQYGQIPNNQYQQEAGNSSGFQYGTPVFGMGGNRGPKYNQLLNTLQY